MVSPAPLILAHPPRNSSSDLPHTLPAHSLKVTTQPRGLSTLPVPTAFLPCSGMRGPHFGLLLSFPALPEAASHQRSWSHGVGGWTGRSLLGCTRGLVMSAVDVLSQIERTAASIWGSQWKAPSADFLRPWLFHPASLAHSPFSQPLWA